MKLTKFFLNKTYVKSIIEELIEAKVETKTLIAPRQYIKKGSIDYEQKQANDEAILR